MAETFQISAQKREATKHSARETRKSKRIPGVVYGHNVEPITFSLDASDFLRTYRRAGTASLIDLDVEGQKNKVLIQEVVLHPVKGSIQHVDLYAVNLKEATNVEVPLEFVGEAPAVKNHGGVFMTKYHSVEVRCLPTDIPHKIEIDLSKMENIHDHVMAQDLPLPKNVELTTLEPEIVICTILGQSTEEEVEGGEEKETEAVEEKSKETEEE